MDQEITFDPFKDIQMGYLTDISMHALLGLWTRYHDKILLDTSTGSHIVTLALIVTLRLRVTQQE
jgi:hypothetical protein